MTRELKFGNRMMGDGHPAYIIAEVGINHNGDMNIAKKIIAAAVHAGADAVNFQKRTPEVCTPLDPQKQMRETPWGYITYLDYRYKVEFSEEQYREIDRYCKEKKIDWMVSVWDEPSVDFMSKVDTPAWIETRHKYEFEPRRGLPDGHLHTRDTPHRRWRVSHSNGKFSRPRESASIYDGLSKCLNAGCLKEESDEQKKISRNRRSCSSSGGSTRDPV